jgi:hypothetical protein
MTTRDDSTPLRTTDIPAQRPRLKTRVRGGEMGAVSNASAGRTGSSSCELSRAERGSIFANSTY